MKKSRACSVLLVALLLPCFSGFAQETLSGTWQGDLVVDPSTTIIVQFIIQENGDGSYSAFLNAPEELSLRNVPATDFIYADDGNIRIEVAAVSGVYEGTVNQGNIRGTWVQEDVSFPLNLSPYAVPVLSQELKDTLRGAWYGQLVSPALTNPITLGFRFLVGEEGEFNAFLDSPDQGTFGIAVDQLLFADNQLTIKVVDPIQVEYIATIEGERMVGEFVQGISIPLTLQKGEYERPILQLDAESKGRLLGVWHGEIEGTGGTIVLRFIESDNGGFVGVLDSPDQGMAGFRISTISLEGNQLGLTIPGVSSAIEAKLSAEQIVGSYKFANGQAAALTLVRGEYSANQIQLPTGIIDRLLGTWEAITPNKTELRFRFEPMNDKTYIALLDVPTERLAGLPITNLVVDDGLLSFTIRGIAAEFNGTLTNTTISGQWSTPDIAFPLVITKVK